MDSPGNRTQAHLLPTEGDVTEILPDQCVEHFLLPLLSARDLCCLSRTCTRMRSICAAPALWRYVTVQGDDRASAVARAPYLRNAVADLCNEALCSAAVHLGSSLLCLHVRTCPMLSDSALCALAPACPLLQDVSISQCGLVGGAGAAALGLLPLERFDSNTMSAADLCTAFSSTGSLFEGLKELLLPAVHCYDPGSSARAVTAIAWACTSLESLHYGQSVPASGLHALSLCCRSLSTMRVRAVLGHAGHLPASPSALARITVDGDVAYAEFSRFLRQCAGTLAALSLGSAHFPLPLTPGLVSSIAELRQLRSLSLVCPMSLEPDDDDEAAVVSELGKCAPLDQLTISGLQLTDALVTGPACSALTVAIFCKTVVCDAVLGLLPTQRLQALGLVNCIGFTPAGLDSFLSGARDLRGLAIVKAREHYVCDDAIAAVLGRCAPSLRELEGVVLALPQLTDGGASEVARLCSSLRRLEDVCIAQCGLVGDAGAAALGRRGLLTGLAQDCWTETVLPLERFASDTMSAADLCVAFLSTGSLFDSLKELLLPVVRGDDAGSSARAVAAIGWACKSLESLHYGQGVPASGLRHLPARPWALSRITVDGNVAAAEFSRFLDQSAGTVVSLSLGSARYPQPLTRALVSRIAELRQLRSLSLVCPEALEPDDDEATMVSKLGKCAPLKKLSLSGLQLTDALVTGPACSALTVAIFSDAVVCDAVLALLPTQSLKTLALVHCIGFTLAGLGSFLSGARCLGRLAIHKAPEHHICDDAMAAVLGGCAGSLPELEELELVLPKLTDSGVSALTSLCSSLRLLAIHSLLLSDVGAEALLRAAPRVLDIDLSGYVRLSHWCPKSVPSAQRIVLPVQGPGDWRNA
eukprot:m51a1_g7949 hypothetical protein (870) ;mRNA; f:152749-157325